ncbi:hypothetical protein ACIQ6V_29320 [Streptomyces sp. NPDC096198]|uniref:hypothetical protein n=1 Tax=Streptomyces sp. NPDC096198 TaxID=3366080 RepID=UPI00381547B3
MRVTRTMFASAAVAAAVAISAPAAHALSPAGLRVAEGGTSYGSHEHDPSRNQHRHHDEDESQAGQDDNSDDAALSGAEDGDSENGARHHHHHDGQGPRGGVRAGGGFLALAGKHNAKHGDDSDGSDLQGGQEEDPQGGGPQEDPQDSAQEGGQDNSSQDDSSQDGTEADSDSSALSGAEDGDSDNAARHHEDSRRDPRGGVHAGGGGLVGDTSVGGLAAGSILLLGGLGAGAYVLRRRNASGAARA